MRGRSGGVSSAWWHVRTALRFALWVQWQKGCLWYLALAAIFMRYGQAGANKAGPHYVILLYCETLLQVLLGIYCKRFCWIPLFTILLLFYVFEVDKAKSATPSVLMILTLNGLLQKNFQVFYFTTENSISLTLSPSHLPPVCFCSIIVLAR